MGISIAKNKIKTGFIVTVIALLLYIIVYFVTEAMGYGENAIVIAALISIGTSFFSYWNSDKMVLSMSGAKKAEGEEAIYLESIIREVISEAKIPMPKIYIIEDSSPNAFATGRNPKNSAVAVTRGIMEALSKEELKGVLAHEVAHIKNYDILLQTVASIMVGAVIIISNVFSRSMMWGGARRRNDRDSGGNAILILIGMVLIIFAPIAGQLLRMALSRNREYLADASAADFTGDPDALANALIKISSNPKPVMRANDATACLYVSDPVKKMKKIANLFSTHPPIEKRVEELRAMRK